MSPFLQKKRSHMIGIGHRTEVDCVKIRKSVRLTFLLLDVDGAIGDCQASQTAQHFVNFEAAVSVAGPNVLC